MLTPKKNDKRNGIKRDGKQVRCRYLLDKVGEGEENLDGDGHASPLAGVDDSKASAGDAHLQMRDLLKVDAPEPVVLGGAVEPLLLLLAQQDDGGCHIRHGWSA